MEQLTKKGEFLKIAISLALVFIGISLRLLPHVPNFTPVGAIALFGGVYLSKKIAFVLPMLVMIITDIFIGFYQINLMIFVYGSFLLCVTLGIWLKKHKKWQTTLASAILAALIFFLVTNFAVWALTPWYPKTIAGISQCYLMALPFFRNTLLGNLFYTSVFFAIYEIAQLWIAKRFSVVGKVLAFKKQ